MNQSNAVFIFDFDGVIVDSVSVLYDTYDNFLKQHGHSGNQKEFDFLNGPKLADIISYLKKKYDLPSKEEELMSIYLELLSSLYHKVNLYEGIKEVFIFLKEENYKVAIASSGKRKDIIYVLEKYDLVGYIDILCTGDDVSESKPSPEIYLLAKSYFPDYEYYVIEDSRNGLEAAHAAKTNTIFFNPDNRNEEENVLYEIHTLSEISNIVEELKLNCFTLAKTNEISLILVNYEPDILGSKTLAIDAIWKEHLKTKNLSKGKIVCYKSHKKTNNTLSIECYITDYKYFFAQLHNPDLNLEIMPLAVSGIVMDENNNILLGIRDNVTEYSGFYELAPSGGISASKKKGDVILYREQLIDELLEETHIKREMIAAIEPYCFIFDKNNGVYDICLKLSINEHLENLFLSGSNEEYRNLEIVNLKDMDEEVKNNRFVPTSKIMLINL